MHHLRSNLSQTVLEKSIQNHTIFLILVFSFLQASIEHPILFAYWHHDQASIQTDAFCKFWATLEFYFNGTILMLLSFASLQRYLFIFHRNLVLRHPLLLHYLPMIFFVVYPFVLYTGLIHFYPCVNQFDVTMMVCGGPCYLYEQLTSTLDILINLALPLFICSIFNTLILVRVLYRKHRMRQQQVWKKNRRLIVHLMSIVLLHDLVWFPAIICLLVMISSPVPLPILTDITLNILPYGYYMVIMLYPVVSIIARPELRPQVLHNAVRPIGHIMTLRHSIRGL